MDSELILKNIFHPNNLKLPGMNHSQINRLIYRRQYLISPKQINCPFTHRLVTITSDLFLYAHSDLTVAEYTAGNMRLVLLGDMFDYRDPGLSNHDILKNLTDPDFNTFVEKLGGYAGRYVILHIEENYIRVVHDAVASRKVYFGKTDQGTWLASQPYLLARVAGIRQSDDPGKREFYGSEDFHRLFNSNIGNTTLYDEISQLLPNHYLDLSTLIPVRYWPNKKVNFIPVNQVADKCARMLQGFVESIANRFDVMVPITGGKDSRTIFSATHNISHKVFYYLNHEKFLHPEHNDVKIPVKLLGRLNLKFNLIDPYKLTIDKDFETVYRQNMEFPLDHFLPHIYNYHVNFSDRVNLPGIFVGSAYEMYGNYDKDLTPLILARIIGVEKYPYALKYFETWLNNCKETCKRNNVNLFTLLYWEERLANWGTQVQLYKDMAQEDFLPFNSREFIECFFSARPRYNDRPGYILYKKIIKRLWPEALKEPFNPGFRHNIFELLNHLGILNLVRRLRFIWIYKMH